MQKAALKTTQIQTKTQTHTKQHTRLPQRSQHMTSYSTVERILLGVTRVV